MDRTELTAREQGRLRRAAVLAIVLAVSAIGIAVLVAPSSRVVDAPLVPTDRPAPPTPDASVSEEPAVPPDRSAPPTPDASVLEDELAKFDCGPDCYGEKLKRTPRP